MNRRFLILAAISLLTAACQKEQPAQETSSKGLKVIASVENTDGNTKTSLDGLNVKWSVGDQIELTNGSQTAIYQATEAAATTTFTKVSGDDLSDGDVYAYYPAGNVTGFSSGVFTANIPAVQAYKADGFADGSNPMTAKGTISGSAVTLAFKNVMSFVKVQINDTAAGKTLAGLSLTSPSANLSGTASVTVGENGVPATVISSGSKTVELDGIFAGLSTAAVSAYVAVPVGELGKLTITAKTEEPSGNYFQTKEAANALTTVRSSVNAYNAIGISTFTGKTLCPSAPANSYMVDATKQTSLVIPLSQAEAGWDAIKALESSDTFDKTKITTGTRTIEVRWFDVEAGTKSITHSVDEKNLTLNFANCVNGTNAVVDLKNGEEVVWSWHIWFTDYKPAADQDGTLNGQVHTYSGAAFLEGGLYEGKVMMDRNLGATITGVSGAIAQPSNLDDAQKYWGLYYQFGRKEPFATTGKLDPAPVNAGGDIANKKTYAYAAQHPAEFYFTVIKSDSWSSTDVYAYPDMTDPWNSLGTKSAFDPCPAGWRIPNNGTTAKNNVWTGITTASWKAETENGNKTAGYLWNGAWLPATGVRSVEGSLVNTGKHVYYWSASPRTAGAGCYAHFNSSVANAADNDPGARSYGFSVRCVKE